MCHSSEVDLILLLVSAEKECCANVVQLTVCNHRQYLFLQNAAHGDTVLPAFLTA